MILWNTPKESLVERRPPRVKMTCLFPDGIDPVDSLVSSSEFGTRLISWTHEDDVRAITHSNGIAKESEREGENRLIVVSH